MQPQQRSPLGSTVFYFTILIVSVSIVDMAHSIYISDQWSCCVCVCVGGGVGWLDDGGEQHDTAACNWLSNLTVLAIQHLTDPHQHGNYNY